MVRTAPCRLAAVVAVGLAIAAAEAIAIPLEACSREKGETWFTSLIEEFWSAEPQHHSDVQYMYTVRSGFALRHICDISNAIKYRPSMYYPVGIAVKPIESVVVNDGSKNVSYMRVLTEYGVDLMIPTAHLAELKDEVNGYIFVDGSANVPYCAISGCSDPSFTETSLLLTPSGPSGVGRYGVVAESTTAEAGCTSYKFYPFELGNQITSESTFLSECWDGFSDERFAVKFVSHASAAERFAYASRGGAFANFVSGHLKQQGLQFWSYKDCLVEDTYKLEGEFGLGGDYYIFSGKLKTSASTLKRRTKDYYHLFSHYYLDGGAYGIEISSYCKDGEPIPTVPKFVQIYHANFPQDYIAISADIVEDSYVKKYGYTGLAPTRGTHLRDGKFYAICGPEQYFYFRNVFRALMGDVSDILYFVSSQGNSEEGDFLEDFYAHVLMSAIVRVGC